MKPTMKALSVVLAFAVLGMSLPDAANAGKKGPPLSAGSFLCLRQRGSSFGECHWLWH